MHRPRPVPPCLHRKNSLVIPEKFALNCAKHFELPPPLPPLDWKIITDFQLHFRNCVFRYIAHGNFLFFFLFLLHDKAEEKWTWELKPTVKIQMQRSCTYSRVVEGSACSKLSKTDSHLVGSIPHPVSSTSNQRTTVLSFLEVLFMLLPCCFNNFALRVQSGLLCSTENFASSLREFKFSHHPLMIIWPASGHKKCRE